MTPKWFWVIWEERTNEFRGRERERATDEICQERGLREEKMGNEFEMRERE